MNAKGLFVLAFCCSKFLHLYFLSFKANVPFPETPRIHRVCEFTFINVTMYSEVARPHIPMPSSSVVFSALCSPSPSQLEENQSSILVLKTLLIGGATWWMSKISNLKSEQSSGFARLESVTRSQKLPTAHERLFFLPYKKKTGSGRDSGNGVRWLGKVFRLTKPHLNMHSHTYIHERTWQPAATVNVRLRLW